MIIDCAYCEGTGKKYPDGRYLDICPVCGGPGKVDAPSDNVECNYCKGTGLKYPNREYLDICPVCNGFGVSRYKKIN